jgi:hypothetical protein
MPYEQYLASASTSAYTSATFASQTQFPASSNSGGGQSAGGGLYSFSRSSTESISYTRFNPETSGRFNVTDSETATTSFGSAGLTITGDYVRRTIEVGGINGGGQGSQKTQYSFTASLNTAFPQLTGNGTISYTDFGSNTYTETSSTTTITYAGPDLPAFFVKEKTIQTTLAYGLRKTTRTTQTFTGPLEGSTTTYTAVISTATPTTFSNIKTFTSDTVLYWNLQYASYTYNIEWIGHEGGGAQNLALIYTQTASNKDISQYNTILMETDSYSSSIARNSFAYGSSFSDQPILVTYTLTYDIITTSGVASQTTLLGRATIIDINSFSYGFIESYTENTTIYTAEKSSETMELVSQDKNDVYIPPTNLFAGGASYSDLQAITTTSSFTQFVELSGLNIATSFNVRSFVTITAPYSFRYNQAGVSGNGQQYTFAPVFPQSYVSIRVPETSNPDTFYTEKASFASFADPNYSIAYNGYSPANCSLVFLALIGLNTSGGEGGQYPSWISVYDGTFSGIDRASTSNQSVTVSQSSSSVGYGSTNVYQTITYFIGNESNSQTTRTTSVAMALINSASSASRLVRTKAENLDSAYINPYLPYLPSIPLNGLDVVFTQGLQGNAGYNIDRLLMNAYTANQSTFAGSGTSSFPISSASEYFSLGRNKIRIDTVYGNPNNSFNTPLVRYANIYI